MTVAQLVKDLELTPLVDVLDAEVTGAYASDLLSDVVGNAQAGNVLITVQVHRNVVAVASLVNLAAVIITNDRKPDDEVLAAARDNNITLLATPETAYTVAGRMYAAGIRSAG